VRSALSKAQEHRFESIGFPLIGAGTGGGSPDQVERMIHDEIERSGYTGRAVIVRYAKKRREQVADGNGEQAL
jgi:O-acetyl-ADP-ribose deacetylase (regulator of RNase III)